MGQRPRSRHARSSRVRPMLWVGLGAAALLVIGGLAGFAIGQSGPASAGAASSAGSASPAGAGAPSSAASSDPASVSRPTMIGQVSRVIAGDRAMVTVAGSEEPVRVLGLDTPDLGTEPGTTAECGSREALTFANDRLGGQMVTLVPDPTLPERDERGARMAYLVLRSQLNYTDAALLEGIGRADRSRPLWYADVFAREQAEAVAGDRGIWGAPCNEQP